MAVFGVGSDYKTILTFFADGVPIQASGQEMPEAFSLEFYTTNSNLKKIATKIDGVYTNCSIILDAGLSKLVVAFDNVDWGDGDVICRAEMVYPDLKFPDEYRTVVQYLETGDSYERL